MSDFTSVTVTSVDDLLQYLTIRLRSWKDDYLHRPDSPQGVTTWPVPHDWRVSRGTGDTIMLRSWKDDYLHRPDSPQGVTTWSNGDWSVEFNGETIRLRSWKGDYLHRPDGPPSLTTWNTGIGNEWHVEAPTELVTSRASWDPYLQQLLKDSGVQFAGIFARNGTRLAGSPELVMSAAEVVGLVAGFASTSELQRAGMSCGGVRYMLLASPIPDVLIGRKGAVSLLAAQTSQTVLVVLTTPNTLPADVTSHLTVQAELKRNG